MRLAVVGALLALVTFALGVLLIVSVRGPERVDMRRFAPYVTPSITSTSVRP